MTVTVVSLTDKVFKRIGMEMPDTETFKDMIKNDPATWDIYARGLTMGINQVEKESTSRKVQRYKPKNISEMSAFVAAVRPGFKSMYDTFESRVDFLYGIPALDNILRTKELPQSYMFYQEQVMNVLNYAGFPMDECYSIIKAIAKKHPEKVKPLKERFIENFKKRLIEEEYMTESGASEAADKVWQIINDNCSYSFNSSHSYCMALDSTYQAWQKAHYPYEFYEVLLQEFSDKGKKDKVAALKQEMLRGFGIKEGDYRFGIDNRKFTADKDNKQIIPSLTSLKGISKKVAEDLYELSKQSYSDFYDLWKAMLKKASLQKDIIETLIKIDYFKQFGEIKTLLHYQQIFEYLYERVQFSKNDVSEHYLKYVAKYSKETDKQYRDFDYDSAIHEIIRNFSPIHIKWNERLKYELECFGFCKSVRRGTEQCYEFVTDINDKYKNPEITLYRVCDGQQSKARIKRAIYDKYNTFNDKNEVVNSIKPGCMIEVLPQGKVNEPRWHKDSNGEWVKDLNDKQLYLKLFKIVA